ncbi:hypothetical protein VCR29J2_360401 [Vibrio coralliirubri]|nr:hypothetical protein VCR29J2_360401 [Vibrio coralliirubri]
MMLFSENYEMYYKKKVEYKTGKVIGIECQPRYKIDSGITLSSKFFINDIYSTNKNHEMFLFTLKESIKHLKHINSSLRVYISVRIQDIVINDLVKAIQFQCTKSSFPTNYIVLQLDDLSLSEGNDDLLVKINDLKNIGVNILIGGSTYNSIYRYYIYYYRLTTKLKYLCHSLIQRQ